MTHGLITLVKDCRVETASHFHLFSINFNNINFGTILFLVSKIGRLQKNYVHIRATLKEERVQEYFQCFFFIDSDFSIGET